MTVDARVSVSWRWRLVLAAVFLSPYVGIVPFNVRGYGVQAAVLLLGVELAWAALAWASRPAPPLRFRADPVLILVALYLAAAVLSGIGMAYAGYPAWAGQTHPEKYLRGLLSRGLLVICFLRVRWAASQWGWRPLVRAYVLSSVLHAVYGIYQFAALHAGLPGAFPPMNNATFTAVTADNLPSPRAFGLTPEPSMLAYMLVPAWAYLAAGFIGGGRMERFERAAFAVISLGLLLTHSRAGMLAAGLAVVALVATRPRLSRRGAAAGGIGFAVLLGAALAGAPEGVWRLHSQDPSFQERLASKRVALRMAADHLLYGAGVGSYPLLAPVYLRPEQDRVFDLEGIRAGRRSLFPNDALLEAFAEMGIPGALTVLAFPGLAFLAVRRGARRSATGLRPVGAGTLGAVASALFSGFIFVSMWVWFGLLSAALLRARAPQARDDRRIAGVAALRLHRHPL